MSQDDKIWLIIYKFAEFIDEEFTWKKLLVFGLTASVVIGVLYLAENPDNLDRLHVPNDNQSNQCGNVTSVSGYMYNYSELEHKCNCLNGTLETREYNSTNTSQIYCKIG